MLDSVQRTQLAIPFDSSRLDGLMEEAGIDVLLATSKHNVQYLLGGHRAFFFDYMDAMGLSRYLPIVIYPKGDPAKAAFIGHRLENHQREVKPFWTPEVQTSASGSLDAAK
jgi:Xaa-Pro aminopeptidase